MRISRLQSNLRGAGAVRAEGGWNLAMAWAAVNLVSGIEFCDSFEDDNAIGGELGTSINCPVAYLFPPLTVAP